MVIIVKTSLLIKESLKLFLSCFFAVCYSAEKQLDGELDKLSETVSVQLTARTENLLGSTRVGADDLLSAPSPATTPEEERKKVKIVRILSIDGGALRGMLPATVLKEMETRTGKSISEMFHIMGGTSIGCLLTAGLTIPKEAGSSVPRFSAAQVYEILRDESPKIFHRRFPWGSVYDTPALEKTADSICGNLTFNQSIIPTMGITFDCLTLKTKPMCSLDEEIFRTRDVLLASSAVPVLFQPRYIYPVNFSTPPNKKYFVADGFLGENNPTAILINEAKKHFPNVEKFEVVSLGNGVVKELILYRLLKGTFTLRTAFLRAFDVGLNLVSEDPNKFVKQIILGNYTRIDPVVTTLGDPFDPSKENLDGMEKDALNFLKANETEFGALLERLKVKKD